MNPDRERRETEIGDRNQPKPEFGVLRDGFDVTSRLLAESEAARRDAEAILERVSDGFIALDSDWRFTYVNEVAASIINREPRELIGKRSSDEFPEGLGQPFSEACRRAAETQQSQFLEEYYPPYDRWFGIRVFPSANGLSIFFHDITERMKREDELRRMNRALTSLSACNRALLRATDESELVYAICRICVEIGGYRMAWVGYAEHDAEKTVRPVAQVGVDEGYLEQARISWADSARGRGPTGTAIRTQTTVIARDIVGNPYFEPWRESALRHGFQSSIALPLVAGGEVLGALNIYASEPDAFDSDELVLLEEFADDLAFGIESVRMRADCMPDDSDGR